nr:unnamed protein product [Callosobruchus chinensis]
MLRNELSAFDRTRIIALWQEGLSRHQIANRLNDVRSTVSRTIRRYEETGGVNSRPRTGRCTVSTSRENRYIARIAHRERSVLSTATIRRRVLASGLRCRRLLRVPLLTARHRTARLQWVRAHQDWLLPQWRNVLFSDESRFGLVSDDYRERDRRERGGQNRLATAIGVAPYRGGTQMFWGGIRFNGRTRLIHIPGTMTGAYYLQNIINAIVQPLRNEIGDQFIFKDDNARPHRTRAVQQALENGNIARLEWPAMSPDMNHREHVWDYVSRAIFNRNNPPRSTQELIVAATEEWDNMPQKVIDNLIIGMHRRVDALIRSRGGNTKYRIYYNIHPFSVFSENIIFVFSNFSMSILILC